MIIKFIINEVLPVFLSILCRILTIFPAIICQFLAVIQTAPGLSPIALSISLPISRHLLAIPLVASPDTLALYLLAGALAGSCRESSATGYTGTGKASTATSATSSAGVKFGRKKNGRE
jgi:hypothetical protein